MDVFIKEIILTTLSAYLFALARGENLPTALRSSRLVQKGYVRVSAPLGEKSPWALLVYGSQLVLIPLTVKRLSILAKKEPWLLN